MANLNKVFLIGRLTRDPEVRTFSNGGKVAKIGFAVNNSRRNQATGEWENEPVFIDVDAFNREQGRKLADQVEQSLQKGQQIFIEGHLRFEQWTSQDGQKRSKLSVRMDNFQFLEPRADGGGPGNAGSRFSRSGAQSPRANPMSAGGDFDQPPPEFEAPQGRGVEEDIPF